MPGETVLMVVLVALLVFFSLRERARWYRYREAHWDILSESKPSPLSRALTNLIGVAGGIYLTLVIIVAFLEIPVPSRVEIFWFSVEPLAATAVALAIIQPFVLRIWHSYKNQS